MCGQEENLDSWGESGSECANYPLFGPGEAAVSVIICYRLCVDKEKTWIAGESLDLSVLITHSLDQVKLQ